MRTGGEPQLTDLEKIACKTAPPPGGIVLRDAGRMHLRLLGGDGECSQFHVMSRTAGGEMLFGDEEKEAFRILMWRLARFSGVEILTYCVMGNHFHLLLSIPRRDRFVQRFGCEEPGGAGERRILEHLGLLYSEAYLSRLQREIAELRSQDRETEVQRVFDRYKARFCDLSLFVKELKERFSRWFNKKHARRGTLWMDRFRSVLVEDGGCLRTVAAYIDLNPVRAGLVVRPEGYRWCGYSEALGGSKRMRRGLCRAIGWPIDHWNIKKSGGKQTAAEVYRCLLYEDGIERSAEPTQAVQAVQATQAVQAATGQRRGIDAEEVRRVIDRGGKLSHFDLVSHRVRWFTEGVAIGSEKFLSRALEDGNEKTRLKPLPVTSGDGSAPWFSLSRLRRQGIG